MARVLISYQLSVKNYSRLGVKMLTQNNQDNSDWKDEAETWAYNQGIDGEMLH